MPSPRMAKTATSKDDKRYFEIVNWHKAQPRMTGANNPWMKLYTSLLDNQAFERLDDSARVLLMGLWLYAARSGKCVFPADPEWIWRKIPFLTQKPDFKPLLEAADDLGNTTPFVRYYDPKKAAKSDKPDKPEKPRKRAKKADSASRTRTRARESREEKSREEQKRAEKCTKSVTDLDNNFARINMGLNGFSEREQKRAKPKHSRAETTAEESNASTAQQRRKPRNPKEPEAESAKRLASIGPKETEVGADAGHHVPARSRSAYRGGNIVRLGEIVGGMFPAHWQDRDAEAFGWDMVETLGLNNNRDDMESRSSWGAFASWWSKLKFVASVEICEQLRAKAFDKAKHLRRYAKAKPDDYRRANWFKIMNAELAKRAIRLPDSRAGPA
jgi:hypothetical protein